MEMSEQNPIWEKYQKLGIIGSGAYGDVYKAKYNNEFFAIKEIPNKSHEQFIKEIEVMKKMECDNSVKFIESFETEDSLYIVSELCFLNLGEYYNLRKTVLSIEEIKELLIDLNKGLKVMYKNKIIHGDIKPSNILLSSNKNNVNKICFKISDFGFSTLYEENNLGVVRGTSQFISPECLRGQNISDKSDIWSLGILIYYLLYQN